MEANQEISKNETNKQEETNVSIDYMKLLLDESKITLFLIPIIYLFGFITYNSYLQNFKIHNTELLDFSYLKAGIISFFIFIIPFLIILNSNLYSFKSIFNSYILIISLIIVLGFSFKFLSFSLMFIFLFTFVPTGLYLINRLLIDLRNNTKIFKKLDEKKLFNFLHIITSAFLIALIIIDLYINSDNGNIFFILGFVLIISFSIIYKLRRINVIDYFSIFILSISYTFLFGKYYYQKIPTIYGGGQPTYKSLILKKEKLEEFNTLKLGIMVDSTLKTKELKIVYENDAKYFIGTSDSTTISLLKDFFNGEALNH
jgi:hypothetical protein